MDVAPRGGRRRQVTRTFDTLKEAREFVAATRLERMQGSYIAPREQTVAQLCRAWLDSRIDVRRVTVQGYEHQLAPVLRSLGSRRVQDITVTDVEQLLDWMSREGGRRGQALSPRAVRAAMVALGQAFDMAVRDGVIARNAVRLARRPRQRRRVKGTELEHWQPEELEQFRDHADSDRLAAAWRLTLCGLTRADVLGLRWSDVDLLNGVVGIAQGRVALDHGDHIDATKSEQRDRQIPVEMLHPGTAKALQALRHLQASERRAAGPAYVGSDLVVVNQLGIPVRPEWYSDRFRALCRSAGVPSIRLHGVRHSLAFWLHQAGVAPADAAALLGHTVEVHLSTYLPHSGDAGIRRAAAALAGSRH
jgi:integrase